MTVEGFELRRYTAEQAAELVDELVAVYLDAHAEDGPRYTAERYRRQLAAHMTRTGWVLVAAWVADEMVGYIYGFPLASDTHWWDGIKEPVPDGFTLEDGRRTFAVAELVVSRAWQRRGIARAVHQSLLSNRSEKRATLLVRPANTIAAAAYRSWGWREVTLLKPLRDGSPTFAVLVKDLQ